MANVIYMTINGEKQGMLSQGCGTADSIGNKYQFGHKDQILIYELTNVITREQNAVHHPLEIRKPIDKSTPLLGVAISNNEKVECEFFMYRTSIAGGMELFFKVKLTGATLSQMRFFYPNSLTHNDVQPQESIAIRYETITWEHISSGTSGWSLWNDRVN